MSNFPSKRRPTESSCAQPESTSGSVEGMTCQASEQCGDHWTAVTFSFALPILTGGAVPLPQQPKSGIVAVVESSNVGFKGQSISQSQPSATDLLKRQGVKNDHLAPPPAPQTACEAEVIDQVHQPGSTQSEFSNILRENFKKKKSSLTSYITPNSCLG